VALEFFTSICRSACWRCSWRNGSWKTRLYIKRNLKAAIDFIGFGLLAVWLATLQIVLDKGQERTGWARSGFAGSLAFPPSP